MLVRNSSRIACRRDVQDVDLGQDVGDDPRGNPRVAQLPGRRVGDFAVSGDDDGGALRPSGQNPGVVQQRLAISAVGSTGQQHDVGTARRQLRDVAVDQAPRGGPHELRARTESGDASRLGRQARHEPGHDHGQAARGAAAGGAVDGVRETRGRPARVVALVLHRSDGREEPLLDVGGDRGRGLAAEAPLRTGQVDDAQLGVGAADVEQPCPAVSHGALHPRRSPGDLVEIRRDQRQGLVQTGVWLEHTPEAEGGELLDHLLVSA